MAKISPHTTGRPKRTERVTMSAVAEKTGVSVMTVSLALRNSPRVAPATRERVLLCAKALGYRRDPLLQALVAHRRQHRESSYTGTIAYLNNGLCPNVTKTTARHINFFRGACNGASTFGLQVEEFWINEPGMTPQRAASILTARGIKGLILGPQPESRTWFALPWDQLSVVQIGRSLHEPTFHTVSCDYFESVACCLSQLAKRNYQRVGFCISPVTDARVEYRYSAAYRAICQKNFIMLPAGAFQFDGFKSWIEQFRPDALLGEPKAILPWLGKARIRIPQDIGFVAPFAIDPKLSIAHAACDQSGIGSSAARKLAQMMECNETGIPKRRVIQELPPVWMTGPSI